MHPIPFFRCLSHKFVLSYNINIFFIICRFQIRGDMVVNSILAAIVAHENNKSSQNHFIYHISSSKINPSKVCDVKLCVFHYFTKNPWVGKDGNIIKVKEITLFSSMDSLRAHISRYYWPLLKVRIVLILSDVPNGITY